MTSWTEDLLVDGSPEQPLNAYPENRYGGSGYRCLVFRTLLRDRRDVNAIAYLLNRLPDIIAWSVDLEDWENVLRVECIGLTAEEIISLLCDEGVRVSELPTDEL